jgi:hypothetical protein
MKRLCLGVVVAIGLTFPAFGQGVDPRVGTWKINLEKSTWGGGTPVVKSQILTFTGEGQNFINTAEGVGADDKPFKVALIHIYDGQPHPVTGSPFYDTNVFVRVGNTINAVRYKNGKAVEVGQGVIVPGKTYTFTTEGVFNGQPYHNVRVFERQ